MPTALKHTEKESPKQRGCATFTLRWETLRNNPNYDVGFNVLTAENKGTSH